jgi:hypothetical protein
MAVQTATTDADEEVVEEKAAAIAPPKPIGALGYTTEIFILLSFPAVAYFIGTEDLDLAKQLLFIGLFTILSLLGGILANVKPKGLIS